MRYYHVTAKCGHVGKDHYIPITFAVKAGSATEAASSVIGSSSALCAACSFFAPVNAAIVTKPSMSVISVSRLYCSIGTPKVLAMSSG